ncbi:gastrin/cholecystokinin type B receptor-like [Asterias rubens]|uniref:gastrin/cholecystokinin type B receptor-like n=1 Tax=Asterias rubens TaxID=7604 RepID=UPI001454EF37|nr:gastrin/cholecystokinin type B receptor-like [Asterias rubens]
MEDIQVSNSSSEIQTSDFQIDVGTYVYRTISSIIILVLGVPGNSLILRVYWSKPLTTSTHILIMSLALTDLLICLCQVSDLLYDCLALVTGQNEHKLFEIMGWIEETCMFTSTGVTILIALDRYDCICRPAHLRFFNASRGKAAAFISFLVAFLSTTPELTTVLTSVDTPTLHQVSQGTRLAYLLFAFVVIIISYSTVYMAIRKHVKIGLPSNMAKPDVSLPKVDQQPNPVTAPIKPEPALLTVPDKSGNNMSLQKVAVASISMVTSSSTKETNKAASEGSSENSVHPTTPQMSTSGSKVSDQVHRDNRGRRVKTTGAPSLQRKTTRMLLITSVVLMVTWLPYCIYICVYFADLNGISVSPIIVDILSQVFSVLYVNNFCNPIIYGLANSRFRKDCVELLRNLHIC